MVCAVQHPARTGCAGKTALDSNGFPADGDFGNAFVKLSTSDGALAVADYFTMHNTVAESNADEDLGSGGLIVMPDQVRC